MKNILLKIILPLFIAFIIGVGGTISAFYIKDNTDKAVNIEKEKQQNENINQLYDNNNKTDCKMDSFIVKNDFQNKILVDKIDIVNKNVRILTYVITKDNDKIKKDIQDLKIVNNIALK